MYPYDRSRRSRRSPWFTLSLIAGGLLLGLVAGVLVDIGWNPFARAQTAGEERAATGSQLPTSIPAAGAATPLAFSAAATSVSTTAPASATSLAPASMSVGAAAPDFTLPDLFDEETTHTLSAFRGRPVIVNFWASWCVPCRREMPALQATAARYAGDGLLLLGMNQTYLDDVDAARAFVEELNLTFPQTRDEDGAVGNDAYRVSGIPTTVFIEPDGVVAHIQIGEMSLEQIMTYTERLMAGEPVP